MDDGRVGRTAFVLALALCAGLCFAVEDALQAAGIDKERAQQSLLSLLRYGRVSVSAATAARSIPPERRAAVVQGLGEFAKAWTRSEDFRRRYASARAEMLPARPAPARRPEELIAAQKAELEKSAREMEKSLAALPKAQQEELRRAMRDAQAAMANVYTPETVREQEAQRVAIEQRTYDEALRKGLPADPQKAIRARLQALLDLTADVDFTAKTRDSGGAKRFVSPAFEAKQPEWKLCFRAGAEACNAARAFAKAWAAELP